MIFLRLFGGASLESDGEALSGPPTQRHRLALLALLCVSHPRPLSRDKLMGYLWPERDARHARRLLNQTLHVLRKALGEGAILSVGDELRLSSQFLDCDVHAFQDALAEADLARAAELYTGPLLDGFFLGDSPAFEHWLDSERERLRRGWRAALRQLAVGKLAAGDADGAAECWRRLLADDLYDAGATIGLMEALEALGDRAGALRQARLHEVLLAEDLGAEPDPAVGALADRIRAGAGGGFGYAGDLAGDDVAGEGAAAARSPLAADENARVAAASAPAVVASRGSRWSWKRTGSLAAALLGLVTMAWASTRAFSRGPARITRIAVLPLANLTGDPRQDYFVAGMHDALISELAKVGALTVYSRQSVLRYKGSDKSLPAIAKELGADALVEGSVFKSGDSVRISVQLVRAQPEQHLLSKMFTGPLSHALALQGKVARAVADATRARITPAVRARLASDRAVEPAAQEAYLSGLYHLKHGGYEQILPAVDQQAEIRLAVAQLEQAVALDSTWAAAWAKLALADHWMASVSPEDADEYFLKSKAAALRAIALDDAEPEAYASLGFVLFEYEWDWAGAERAIRRANELDPNSHHWTYALYLKATGRLDEAIAEFQKAEERDPASDVLKAQVAAAYGCAGRYDEAIAQARALNARVAGADTASVLGGTRWLLAFTAREFALAGAHDNAIDAAQRLLALTDTAAAGPSLAFALAMAGRREEARAVVATLGPSWARRVDGSQPGVFAALGDTARALAATTELVHSHWQNLVPLRCWPVYKLLRHNARFQELISPIGFPRVSAGG